jgi:U3 small nucleolar ribonucleoprotein protein IMP3
MRKLQYHEYKLLKKVDLFGSWKDENPRESSVIRKYHLTKRSDYQQYNRLVGIIKKLSSKISDLHPKDPFRDKMSDALMAKLYQVGLITGQKSLSTCEKVSVSAFCRRRLPVVMTRLKMAETVSQASIYIEQGHVRVGIETITDPAFLVTRSREDFVTWVDSSKIKSKILTYNDQLDDYDLLQ